MKVSLQSLSRWVDIGHDIPELSHALTMAGLEVEGQSTAAPAMSGIVVAEVISTSRHPDADKLSVCRVNNGEQEIQIVCGASNVRAGIKVPLATVGAKLPGGMEIKAAKLRGVESFGMLCSAKELGLAEESQGLLELPTDLKVGENLVKALALDDVIFEINLTPNRGDCMSVLGVAREVAAQRNAVLNVPVQARVEAVHAQVFPVRIESIGCGKFVSRVIKGVTPAARSPWWLQERLRRAGVRPISAIVDITNYVLLELGQPMHAYDLGKLQGGIVVRQAVHDEQLTLLDGKSIKLTNDILVIADRQNLLGMAGVMGGLDTAISDSTIDVLLEVAFFEPDAIAGRGRRFGLVTDASQRFERGVDFNLQERAMELATELVLQCAGGAAGPTQVTVSTAEPTHLRRNAITLRHARLNRMLGHDVPRSEVERIIAGLGMRAKVTADASGWHITPPSWRFDLVIEEDMIEEVARIYGYDRIPANPALTRQRPSVLTETRIPLERVAQALVDRGYQEAITYSFTDPTIQQALFPDTPALTLSNPISAELGVMRLSLWPGLIQAVLHNQKRQQPRIRLFETGRQFSADGRQETAVVAGVVGGTLTSKQWGTQPVEADFYDAKADVESLLAMTGQVDEFTIEAARHPALHPGQSAHILRGGQVVGWLGTLSPALVKSLDMVYSVIVFELKINSCFASQLPEYKEISKFPMVRRDLALVVNEAQQFSHLAAAVRESAGPLLKDVGIFDVYLGEGLEKGKKSIALGINLQDTSRTLTDAEVDAAVTRIVEHLAQRLDARLR